MNKELENIYKKEILLDKIKNNVSVDRKIKIYHSGYCRDILMKDPTFCCAYASIHGEMPEAEDYIATDPLSCYRYSLSTKKVFPKGEKTLINSKEVDLIYFYCANFSKRLIDAEPLIFKNTNYIIKYAISCYKERIYEEEDFIFNSCDISDIIRYIRHFDFHKQRVIPFEKRLIRYYKSSNSNVVYHLDTIAHIIRTYCKCIDTDSVFEYFENELNMKILGSRNF